MMKSLTMSLAFTTGRLVILQLLKYRKVHLKNMISRNNFHFNNEKPGFMNYTILAGLLFSWISKAKDQQWDPPPKPSISSVIEQADQLFEIGHYEECLEHLKKSQAEGQDGAEIQWRISRIMYNMSRDSRYEKHYKRKLISQAFQIISEALETNYENAAVQKWYALLLDAESSEIGIKEKILQLENVKKHMDLAVTYNPNDATTLYMLGEWCYQVSEMPWHQRKIAEAFFGSPPHSTYEDAVEYFLRAESTQPRFYSLNLLRLGACYLKLGKEDQAKYYLKLAASYPAKSNDDHRANKEAAELLTRLKN